MRKSTAHLRDASRFLSTIVDSGKVACQKRPLTGGLLSQQQQLLSLNRIPDYGCYFLRNMSSASSAVAIQDDNTTFRNSHSYNHQLRGSLAIFNLTDRMTIANLDLAIQSRNADKAWSIFVTLTSHNHDSIPLSMCRSLYSLLTFAKPKKPSKIAKRRQQQLNHLLDHVQLHHTSLDLFLASVKKLPTCPHKQLLQVVRAGNKQEAWVTFFKFHKQQRDAKLSRNTCLELMLLLMKDKHISENQLKMRLELIALHGAGSSKFDSRYISAADLTRFAHIHHGYQNNDITTAHKLIDDFALGIAKKKKSYRADALDELIWRILLQNDLKKGHQILEKVQTNLKNKIDINEMVFINLMNAYRRKRDYHRSLQLFEQLLETDKHPSIRAFNTVLQILAVQGLADRANYIFDTIVKLDIQPDVATYTEMIRAHSYAGNYQNCIHFYNEMILNNVQPNNYTFSALIKAAAREQDLNSVFYWFQTMLSYEIEPNEVVITCVLDSLSKQQTQYPTIPEIILQIAHQATLSGVKTDTALYTILLKMRSDIESTHKIHRNMLQNLVEPNTYTYTMLIDICGKNKMTDSAEKIFDLMKKSTKYRPNTVTYTVMMDVWNKAERKEKFEAMAFEFLIVCKSDRTGRFWLDSGVRKRIESRCCL